MAVFVQTSATMYLFDSTQDWAARHLQLLPVSVVRHRQFELDILGLIKHFAGHPAGYILCDTAVPESMHIAVSLSGVLKVAVGTAQTAPLLRAAGLQQLLNASQLDQRTVFEKYQNNFSKRILFNQKVRLVPLLLSDLY